MKITAEDIREQRVKAALRHAKDDEIFRPGTMNTDILKILADEVLRIRRINSELVKAANDCNFRNMQLEQQIERMC